MSSAHDLTEESDRLHARVRAFARGDAKESFDDLGLAIADYQARWSPGHAKLRGARGRPTSVDEIPAVPVDAFRVTRVAIHSPADDVVRFFTSGTTSGARGVHALRTTATYEALAVAWGERALSSGSRLVIALAPAPGIPGESSLGFMLRLFMRRFDGGNERWLVGSQGVDMDGVERALEKASASSKDVLVLATSFALVELVDHLAGKQLLAPKGSVVMLTGGFKGRSREVDPDRLRQEVALGFGIPRHHVVSEYGMTELTSQLYDFTLEGGVPGVYRAPPWLRVTAVDPVTLTPVPNGEVGLARFVDLGNVDSAVAIVTQDLVRVRDDGLELVGRQTGAMPRGCSLAIEELVLGAKATPS